VALMVGAGLGKGTATVEAQKSPDPVLHNPDPMSAPTPQPGVSDDISGLPPGPVNPRINAERAKAFNEERHKRLEDDVIKLQALTNELKTDVDKADKDELSMVVMRKAAEIEKLAHDVQSRMKN
jgi:hypothetical protein